MAESEIIDSFNVTEAMQERYEPGILDGMSCGLWVVLKDHPNDISELPDAGHTVLIAQSDEDKRKVKLVEVLTNANQVALNLGDITKDLAPRGAQIIW